MKLLEKNKALARLAVVLGIAAVAVGVALLLGLVSGPGGGKADDFFYDSFYRLRPQQDMSQAEVVLVAVDDASIDLSGKPWPWPRTMWGDISTYLDHAGAKVIAFDVFFPNPSYYRDDEPFAAAMNALKTPVIFGAGVKDDGGWEPFAPPVKEPTFGAINLGKDIVYRAYPPELYGQSSLAEITSLKAGGDLRMIIDHPERPFLLHYYGPHVRADGKQTFHYVNAYNVWYAQTGGPEAAAKAGISPDMFKGKVVVLCAIARAAFDLKSSPFSAEYPGPEIQATAIENILRGQQVHMVPGWIGILASAAAALLVTAGVVYPRRATLKIAAPVLVTAGVMALCIGLFRGETIWWLSPVVLLAAIVVASPLAFGWTYFSEDRQRRFMLKALSKVVSPAVAEQLSREPERLALGTTRGQISVLFTDLANFTDLSEGMDVQNLGTLVNRYLGEMSAQVIAQDGTLDKYIGDAVMCFWNAPLPQADHALRACRAALAMVARERELQAEFVQMIADGQAHAPGRVLPPKRLFTRIGINTASVAVGFVGSEHLFNYTAMGDGVNLASRIEGANKMYGSQILLAESTAELVKERFYVRRLDVLRVKGKQQPMPVYELLAERGAAARSDLEERIIAYEAALAAYEARDWEGAEQKLLELCARFGEDGPAQALLTRVREFRIHPPAEGWDGVYVATTK